MRNTTIRRTSVVLLLILALALGACSSGDDAGGVATDVASDEALPDIEPGGAAIAPEDGSGRAVSDGGESAQEEQGFGDTLGRKVIREATIELIGEDPESVFDDITAYVESVGGFVAAADVRRPVGDDTDQMVTVTATVRVPAASITGTLDRIASFADEVTAKTIGSRDVTEEYTDIEAQLVNLRALEIELRELLTEVRQNDRNDPTELLAVFERLRSVRSDIERLEGRQRLLEDLVDLATVDVTIRSAVPAQPVVDEWAATRIARAALHATVDTLQLLANGLIWLAIFVLPVVVMIGLPAWLLWRLVDWIARRSRRPGEPAGEEHEPALAVAGPQEEDSAEQD